MSKELNMNPRARRLQQWRREWNQSWTRTWRPWTETYRQVESLRLEVKPLDPLAQQDAIYSTASVPFHACGDPGCSVGGIDLRPLVHHAIAERKTTIHGVEVCKGRDEGFPPHSCRRSVEVSGSITYKPTHIGSKFHDRHDA